ncbi:ATP-binding protein [Desulfopila sp. IMCC35008]|uniref:ATP-binding protein n=1 Tax=Desulfopila sp. IMCC35008 TaxID=2653858 RepID=UPI00197AA9A2|nr:ATP-binding protein [Desulfopila sp. IMCC35008]
MVSVTDNGYGINTEPTTMVFDPFYTTKEVGKGLGLGLSIAYNITKRFGGRMTVQNGENGGACFPIIVSDYGFCSRLVPLRCAICVFVTRSLERLLIDHGLPPLPLVPVSSSKAIVGAVIGMGLLKGGRLIKWKVVGGITCGWVTTPLIAGVVSFVCLFIAQNVFLQQVFL